MTIPNDYVLVPRELTPEMLMPIPQSRHEASVMLTALLALYPDLVAATPAQPPMSAEVEAALEGADMYCRNSPDTARVWARVLAAEVLRLRGMTGPT